MSLSLCSRFPAGTLNNMQNKTRMKQCQNNSVQQSNMLFCLLGCCQEHSLQLCCLGSVSLSVSQSVSLSVLSTKSCRSGSNVAKTGLQCCKRLRSYCTHQSTIYIGNACFCGCKTYGTIQHDATAKCNDLIEDEDLQQ